MLKGIDISHYNKNMKNKEDLKQFDFVFMKASEGKGFKDYSINQYCAALEGSETVKGFYHFARPECGNLPIEEASNFLLAIQHFKKEKPLLALDVEARALEVPFLDNWCLQFCEYVYKEMGYKPLIYCSEAETKRFKKCASFGAGLWVAKWGSKKPTSIKPWPFFAFWQYTSSGAFSGVRVDLDYFNGTRDQLLKYCEVLDHEEAESNRRTIDTTD